MIIELCGAPGAGKSSIASEVVDRLRRDGHPASLPLEEVSPRTPRPQRLLRKVQRAAGESARHPREFARIVGAVARSGQPTWRDVAIRSLNWQVLRAALRRARAETGFHVIDQGIVQELCSLAYRGNAEAVIEVADPGAGRLAADVIVVVETEPWLADRRLEERPGRESRVEAPGVDRRREIERQGRLVEELLASWWELYADRVPTTTRRFVNGDTELDVGDLVASLRPGLNLDAIEAERTTT